MALGPTRRPSEQPSERPPKQRAVPSDVERQLNKVEILNQAKYTLLDNIREANGIRPEDERDKVASFMLMADAFENSHPQATQQQREEFARRNLETEIVSEDEERTL